MGIDEDQAIADYMTAWAKPNAGDTRIRGAGSSRNGHRAAEANPVVETREPESSCDSMGLLALALLLWRWRLPFGATYLRERRLQRTRLSCPSKPRRPRPVLPRASRDQIQLPHATTSSHRRRSSRADQARGSSLAATTQAALHAASPGYAGVVYSVAEGNDESDECWVSIVADGKPTFEVTLVALTARKSIRPRMKSWSRPAMLGALDFFFNGQKLPRPG